MDSPDLWCKINLGHWPEGKKCDLRLGMGISGWIRNIECPSLPRVLSEISLRSDKTSLKTWKKHSCSGCLEGGCLFSRSTPTEFCCLYTHDYDQIGHIPGEVSSPVGENRERWDAGNFYQLDSRALKQGKENIISAEDALTEMGTHYQKLVLLPWFG